MQSTKRTVLNGHSPVNQYQVFCLEQSDGGRTLERITLAFKALDELIPKLGVYTKVFHQLRQDLFDAVFSDQLTGSHGDGDTAALVVGKLRSGGDVDDYIQRIPFFSTVSQVLTARDVRADELTDQLDTVKERLFEKHKQFEKSEYRVSELEQQVAELTETVRGLENDVADYKEQLNQLELRRQEEGEKAAHVQKQLEAEVAALQEALEDSRAEIEFLQQYKNGYDNLQEAFSEPTEYDYSRHRSRAVISTKRANLISGIQSAQTLEQQLLAVLNATVEEYDVFLEDHKEDLLEKELTDELTETEMVMQEMEIDTADQQLQQVQIRFKESVDEMTTELSLVRKHITMLQEQLQILEENKPTLQPKESRRASSDRRLPSTPERVQREESVLSAGLGGDEEEDEMLDPFIPQERVFSKYAAMMYTSNNDGKTFHELKEAQFCPSCGEKTVVCPHKLGSGDAVMMLPRGCTHIKVARPNVRINRDLVGALLKPGPQFELAPSTAESKFALRRGGRWVSRDSLATPMSMDTIDSPILGGTESALIQPMNRLWEDYKRRTHLERTIPRPLSLTRCLSMIEQFCSHLLWQDDFGMEADGFFSINDNLYRFLKERYIDEDVQYLAAHDFLSALVEYQPISKMIQLLCHVLVGNLDASCLRYVLLMNDFIAAVDWSEVADFRAFSSVVYPFLNEDDLESLQMSYTSFTENRISPQLVSQFIINVILKYREPRFLDIENRLLALQTRDSGLVGESEFVAMLEHVLPLASDKLRRRLFWETERQARADGVVDQAPLIRVAQMTSYLGLVQISPVVRETVRARVEEWRERPTSSGSVRKSGRETQLVTSQEKLLTSCDLRNLAANVARRARHRDRRLQDEDW